MQTLEFDAPLHQQDPPDPNPTQPMDTTRPPRTKDPRANGPLARGRAWFDNRTNGLPPWLVVTQLFFGLGWARAAVAKIISPSWWTGTTITDFVAEHQVATLTWFQGPAAVAADLAVLTALVVLVAQLAAAASLITNRFVGWGLAVASALNLSFLAIGAVNPSAFYLIGQGALALWMLGRLRATAGLSKGLRFAVAGSVALAAISLPDIATLHPSHVIDDPAVMMATLAALTALACELTHRSLFSRGLP